MARPKSSSPRNAPITIRLTLEERAQLEAEAEALNLPSLSEYIRHLHRSAGLDERRARYATRGGPSMPGVDLYPQPELFAEFEHGSMWLGDSLGMLHGQLAEKSVDLIMTSPPFGLVRKKSYGNEDAEQYVAWFRPFAEGFRRVLKDTGSLVIDIGGAWKPGLPVRSLYHFKLLLMLCEEFGFYLAEEHYWWNPARLPTPAEWVNVRRIRVKDAVNCIWWLSPTPWPRANNRRVLAPYSDAMLDLLEKGYTRRLRPSGHDISDKFGTDNGGSVPPNLLALANTESNGRYQAYCREKDLPIHPARYPAAIPEYFVRMLTDRGDLVVDPFGGSCVTGEVCEMLEREWRCCELSREYLEGARARFQPNGTRRPRSVEPPSEPACPHCGRRVKARWVREQQRRISQGAYSIPLPLMAGVPDDEAPLPRDGGRTRPSPMATQAPPLLARMATVAQRSRTLDDLLAMAEQVAQEDRLEVGTAG